MIIEDNISIGCLRFMYHVGLIKVTDEEFIEYLFDRFEDEETESFSHLEKENRELDDENDELKGEIRELKQDIVYYKKMIKNIKEICE